VIEYRFVRNDPGKIDFPAYGWSWQVLGWVRKMNVRVMCNPGRWLAERAVTALMLLGLCTWPAQPAELVRVEAIKDNSIVLVDGEHQLNAGSTSSSSGAGWCDQPNLSVNGWTTGSAV